jgi:hypothetical protein
MAALICDSVSKLCGSCTDACGSCCQVVAVPCRAVSQAIQGVICSPFFPFLFVTILCNVPPMISAAKTFTSCHWNLVNAGFCLVNIIAAFYMVHKLQQNERILVQAQVMMAETGTTAAHTGTSKTDYQTMPTIATTSASNSSVRLRDPPGERMKKVLCYDAGVAVYILIALVWLVWLMYGFPKAVATDNDACGILYAIFCATCYIIIAGCAFACSLVCLK